MKDNIIYGKEVSMKKSEAIKIFGSVRELANALGITPQAIYLWDEDLSERRENEIIGTAFKLGLLKKMTNRKKVS